MTEGPDRKGFREGGRRGEEQSDTATRIERIRRTDGAPLFLRPSALLTKLNMYRASSEGRERERADDPSIIKARKQSEEYTYDDDDDDGRLLRHTFPDCSSPCGDYAYDECEEGRGEIVPRPGEMATTHG